MMRILAIFTCYNRRDLTERGIGTLRANEQVAFDYVIVNDGSTDGTETMLAVSYTHLTLPTIYSV